VKLRLVAENESERKALESGDVPTAVVQMALGMAGARALMSAVELGLFRLLAKEDMTSDRLAAAAGCRCDGLEALLPVLQSFGHVERRSDARWANTPATTQWLLPDSTDNVLDLVRFNEDQWGLLSGLVPHLRTETPRDLHEGTVPPGFWERYLRALRFAAGGTAEEVAQRLPFVESPRRLLDVGGGLGTYSQALCRAYPELEACVLELPPVVELARRECPDPNEGVIFRCGDCRSADWGEGWDGVLIFNLSPHLNAEENRSLFRRASLALRPGALLAVLQPLPRKDGGEPDALDAVSGLFYELMAGRPAYPEETLRAWMQGGGFDEVQSISLTTAPGHLLLVGRASA
jgi:demethylspheroidene O-methyltransferase